MSETAKLQLPYLEAGQAQKEVTHNEALALLDAAAQAWAVESRGESAPPAAPAEGAAWLVAAGASGAWDGQEGAIALWLSGWRFLAPAAGMLTYVKDEGQLLLREAGDWRLLQSLDPEDAVYTAAEADGRFLRHDGAQGLGASAQAQARANAGVPTYLGTLGWGLEGGQNPPSLSDLDAADLPSGAVLYIGGATGGTKPAGMSVGGGLLLREWSGNANNYSAGGSQAQLVWARGEKRLFFRVLQSNSSWSDWVELVHAGNLGALPAGDVAVEGALSAEVVRPGAYTVAGAPDPATAGAGAQILVTNGAAGQPVLAFSDGSSWRRCDSLEPVSAS